VLNGTGAPASTLGSDGDFYIDTAADVLYGPKAGGAWPATGTSLVGNPGATGPAGPAGPQGPAGPAGGLSAVTDLGGLTCTTNGGAAGTLSVESAASDNTIAFQCGASSTDANCTHSNGLGQNYTDCNDLLGTPGNELTYRQAMALDAAIAYNAAQAGSGSIDPTITNVECLGPAGLMPVAVVTWDVTSPPTTGSDTVVTWAYRGGALAGRVHTFTGTGIGGSVALSPTLCPTTSDPTWN
jgi:hypothetical protein